MWKGNVQLHVYTCFPKLPYISLHMVQTDLYTFPVLRMRSLSLFHLFIVFFLNFLSPFYLIKQRYCKEKLDAFTL